MSVGFGFSVGDFIAAIELVGTVIDALQCSGSAAKEYRELISQLISLENALLQVKRLEFDDSQYAEVIALRQAASQCQRTIDVFWKQAQKYQPHLACEGRSGTRSDIKVGWMKVKWALFKREDVTRFKADLVGHTESIHLLLATLQMSKATIHEKKLDDRHQTLAGRVQEGFFSCMQRLSAITEQGKRLLEMTTSVMTTNIKIFQAVLQIQQLITRIPGQVERQQPVYLLDAMGRTTPFHLEFVRSAEALVAVLKINFQKHGKGTEKIERGEFAIQDSGIIKDIDLKADWEQCFFPGQRVDMSMIFTRHHDSMSSDDDGNCPFCGHKGSSLAKDKTPDIECCKCGMTYRRIVEEEMEPDSENDDFQSTSSLKQSLPLTQSVLGKRKRTASEDELTTFRRVRLHVKFFAHVPEEEIYLFPHHSPASDTYLESTGDENRNHSATAFSKAVHFDSHLEHVRHFLQVDRPLAVSAGSSPVEAYESDTEFPFREEDNARGSPTTRSGSGNNDENVTIKITGRARVMVGGAQINCPEGGEIEIKQQKSIRNGSGYPTNRDNSPPMNGSRRDSFAVASALFFPKHNEWHSGDVQGTPSNNPFVEQNNNPFMRVGLSTSPTTDPIPSTSINPQPAAYGPPGNTSPPVPYQQIKKRGRPSQADIEARNISEGDGANYMNAAAQYEKATPATSSKPPKKMRRYIPGGPGRGGRYVDDDGDTVIDGIPWF